MLYRRLPFTQTSKKIQHDISWAHSSNCNHLQWLWAKRCSFEKFRAHFNITSFSELGLYPKKLVKEVYEKVSSLFAPTVANRESKRISIY